MSTHRMTPQFETLIAAIKARRKALGITQEEAAQLCGVGSQFMNHVEKGKPTLWIDKVFLVAWKLGVDINITTRNVPEPIKPKTEPPSFSNL